MKLNRILTPAIALAALSLTQTSKADVIANWTFESSGLGSSTPSFTPGAGIATTNFYAEAGVEAGTAAASGLHAGNAVYTSPVGQGSVKSFSSTLWAVGDFYQYAVSTVSGSGFYTNLTMSFDIASSNTGPGRESLFYSLDGTSFTAFGGVSNILANGSPNFTWNSTTATNGYNISYDLSSITALADASTVYFRVEDPNTTSANGGTVGTGGTERMDNVIIGGTFVAVPEPTSLALAALGGFSVLGLSIFRKRK